MANIEITNVDRGSIALGDEVFRDDIFTAAGAGTIKAGTILARDSVSLKLVVFAVGGATNENGIPKAVLPYDVVAAGAGDLPVRALVAGKVNKDRLIVAATGDGSTITKAHLDQLRSYSIVPVDVKQTSTLDNQ